MFWESVGHGLGVLTYWQTYVAGLEYLLIFLAPMMVFGIAMQKGGGSAGCLGMLLMPLVQVAAMAIFVITLSPIILGAGEDAAWSLPWMVIGQAPGLFLKLIGSLFLAALVLAFIPLFGRVQALQTLILGSIALAFVLNILRASSPELENAKVDLIPGFWFTVGLVVVGAGMSWIGIMVAALALTAVGAKGEEMGSGAQLLVFPIAAIFGFIPVFIYGAWLGSQLKHAM
jgi:hypothetical protein